MHLEQILKNLPLGVGTPYQKTGLKSFLQKKGQKINLCIRLIEFQKVSPITSSCMTYRCKKTPIVCPNPSNEPTLRPTNTHNR